MLQPQYPIQPSFHMEEDWFVKKSSHRLMKRRNAAESQKYYYKRDAEALERYDN